MIKPMLGNWEIRGIQTISTEQDRHWHEYTVPQLDGSIFQNQGEFPTAIEIRGSVFGDNARDLFLTEAREKFQSGEPTTFVADILTATDVNNVVIEDLEVIQIARGIDHFLYRMLLKEFVPPPTAPEDIGDDIGLEAEDLLDNIESGLIDLPQLPDLLNLDLVNPVEPLRSITDSFTTAVAGTGSVLQSLSDLIGESSE